MYLTYQIYGTKFHYRFSYFFNYILTTSAGEPDLSKSVEVASILEGLIALQ